MSDGTGSLKERMAAGRVVRQEATIETIQIPGCKIAWEENGVEHEATLHARYHGLGYKAARAIGLKVAKETKDPADREMYAATDQLVAACEGIEAHTTDGEIEDLGVTLGHSLGEYLHVDVDGMTPRQAVFAVVPDTTLLMGHFKRFATAFGLIDVQIDEDLAGN